MHHNVMGKVMIILQLWMMIMYWLIIEFWILLEIGLKIGRYKRKIREKMMVGFSLYMERCLSEINYTIK